MQPRRLVFASCILLIGLSLAVIAWRLPRLLGQSGSSTRKPLTPEVIGALLNQSFPVEEGRSLRLAESSADYLVLFLFTPADCAACLPELRELENLAKEQSNLGVVAVMSYSNFDEARQTRENFGVDIPILQDPEGELLTSVSPLQTPWKLMIRREDRRLLFEDGRTVTTAERAAFLARVREQLSEDSGRNGTHDG